MTEHDTPITTPVVGVGDRPIFVVGAPGNGAEHLVPALLASPGAWDATAVVAEVSAAGGAVSSRLEAALEERRSGIDWSRLPGDASPRMIAVLSDPERELATLLDLFPDAIVVQVHRSPEAVLAEAGDAEAAAEGWARAARQFLSRAEALPDDRCVTVAIESLLAEPDEELQRLFRALGLGWSRRISNVWRKSAVRLLPSRDGGSVVLADAEELQALDAKVRERVPALRPSLLPTSGDSGLTALDNGLASLLRRLGSSLLVSTYQTDRLISLRAVPGGLGVHLRAFDRPMGMAVFPGGLAVGIRSEILEYRDLPEAASGLEPKGLYDACYLPRNSHVTGDIAVHDLGVGRDGLWAVATQFSCLATLDAQHSFVPRWQPPFITALAPEDRCHLNGMAIVDGLPRYATALGVSDEAGGWRPGKASGGVLMKVPTGEVLVEGLSMPHSPRWHEGSSMCWSPGAAGCSRSTRRPGRRLSSRSFPASPAVWGSIAASPSWAPPRCGRPSRSVGYRSPNAATSSAVSGRSS